MGLDMHLRGEKFFWDRTEDGLRVNSLHVELGYWRKHPNLHGFIVNTFADGKDHCQKIELGETELNQMIEAVKAKNLPETTGFFFGKSYGDEDEVNFDLEILTKALEWVNTEEPKVIRTVYYQASW